MFTKRSWESFYSGLIMVGLIFMVFPVIYFCGATKEKQILPPLIMFVVSLFVDYENTGSEAAILIIGTAVISVIEEKINKKEIEKMKCREEEELKDIV